MPVTNIEPYLFFDGTAAQALAFYEQALGAKPEGVMRYADAPGPLEGLNSADAQRIMHARVHIGGAVIMMGDIPTAKSAPMGAQVEVCLHYDDVDEMKRAFVAMAEGGEVGMAPHHTFWGATFGTLTDRYGISWMFNCDERHAPPG
jgi:PhnB protein